MRQAFGGLLAALFSSAALAAPAMSEDPYLWLEQVSSPRAMAWVEAHNARATSRLEADPRYPTLYAEALAIAGAKDRIPTPTFLRGEVYNFWQDPEHLRGYWRRTTLADYANPQPSWTTVLDVDALNKAEGRSFVWHGVTCLQPQETRCLVALSDGGEDADELREFDLVAGRWVEGGFHLPRSKQNAVWEDADTLLVSREWTPGELTTSGYPYIVKRLKRGQPLSAAVEVFRGEKSDVSSQPQVLVDGAGRRLSTVSRGVDFFHTQTSVLDAQGARRLALPEKSEVLDLVAGRVIVKLDEPWTADGASFPSGSLIALDLASVKADPARPRATLVRAPGRRESIEEARATRDRLLVATLDNVRGRAFAYTPTAGGGWSAQPIAAPDNATLSLGSTDSRSDRAFLDVSGFLQPSSLRLVDAAAGGGREVKALPPKFDASGDVVEQFEAASTDGVRIPYFVVHRRDVVLDGSTPTLMTAYGGFQVSETPHYSGAIGKLWLERGGAYVLANIRGGGEFGPDWHEAALKTKRQVAYDDFASVAKDLFARRITSPRRLGIQGGSNGGLLMGVEFTQHPELWHAVVIQVPLLDMIRIGQIAAGASWQGEYGDVAADPAAMAFWRKTSPYQNLRAGVNYPEPFIFTTTKDDRVGPQHARKFAARMEEMRLPFLYYENTEGGHGAGADLKQAAHTTALTMTYLQEKLMDAPPAAASAAAAR